MLKRELRKMLFKVNKLVTLNQHRQILLIHCKILQKKLILCKKSMQKITKKLIPN